MADRWKPENPIEGKYIWLPLKVKDNKLVELEWKEKWDLSIFSKISFGRLYHFFRFNYFVKTILRNKVVSDGCFFKR